MAALCVRPLLDLSRILAVNRGKRSITVSLVKPESQHMVRELAQQNDIVLEITRPVRWNRTGWIRPRCANVIRS